MKPSHAWQQHGTVSLWRYRDNARNFPGWQLTADAEGCASLLTLLDALHTGGAGASRTLQLSAPGPAQLAVPNNRDARWVAPQTMQLILDEDSGAWQWQPDGERQVLRLGVSALAGLRQGVLDIAAGQGDYSLGHGMEALWFWWWNAQR